MVDLVIGGILGGFVSWLITHIYYKKANKDNELEIDMLAEKIKEANEIIAFCSDKLTKADKEIEKLLAEKRECEE